MNRRTRRRRCSNEWCSPAVSGRRADGGFTSTQPEPSTPGLAHFVQNDAAANDGHQRFGRGQPIRRNREDVLRIMRDHAIGSYGGVALAVLIALKVTAYSGLLKQPNWIPALVLPPALGRWSILLLTAALPYARPSASVVETMGRRPLLWGTLVVAAALGAARSGRACAAATAVVAVTACFGFYCRRRIGGITGDTLGANVQLCESAALLTFLWGGHPR